MLECTKPILTRERLRAKGNQVVGQDRRGAFSEPVVARLVRGVLERHDQLSRADGDERLRLDVRGNTKSKMQHAHKDCCPQSAFASCMLDFEFQRHAAFAGLTSTDSRHCPAPVARHCSVPTSTSRLNRYISRRMAEA